MKKIIVYLLIFSVCISGYSYSLSEDAYTREQLQDAAYREIIKAFRDDIYRNFTFLYDEYDNEKQIYKMYYRIDTVPHNSAGWITWDSFTLEATAKYDSDNNWTLSIIKKDKNRYPNEGIIGSSFTGYDNNFSAIVLSVDTESSTIRLRVDVDNLSDGGHVLTMHEESDYPYTIENYRNNPALSQYEMIVIDLGKHNDSWYTLEAYMTHPMFSDVSFESVLTGTSSGKYALNCRLEWNITYDQLKKYDDTISILAPTDT